MRAIELHANVNDLVYFTDSFNEHMTIEEGKVFEITIGRQCIHYEIETDSGFATYTHEDFGEFIFTDRSDAEEKIRGRL